MTVIYVDTSSALKLLLEEEGTDRVQQLFGAAKHGRSVLASSRLLRTEMHRIAFRESIPLPSVTRVLAYVHLVDVTRAILDSAGELPFHLRTLDAIHLATAATLSSDDDEVQLLTDDSRMRDVGQAMGIGTVP
ncbi:type II toxin-antitoxin system VapC family toxin [Georgenia sp. Z1491]|uniref:type II toxin-antitoxin system VapC family toxin n=1 Tax=Georgenia sp. Z1491 TaxID=3416707 RepID=UPI003CF8A00D